MTNTNCCDAGCGVEYCGAENNVDFSTYFWVGFVILAIVLLAVANANLVPATGVELMDGSTYIDLYLQNVESAKRGLLRISFF